MIEFFTTVIIIDFGVFALPELLHTPRMLFQTGKFYRMIGIDLSKQQALDADPTETQQIDFTRNLAREGNEDATIFFVIEEAKETILDFSQGTVRVL